MAPRGARTVRLQVRPEHQAAVQPAVPPALQAQLPEQAHPAQAHPAWQVWQHWAVQQEPQVVALSAQRRGAPSWPEVRQEVPSGSAALERAAFWPRSAQVAFPAQVVRPVWLVRRVVRREPAVQQGARLEPSALVSAAWPAGALVRRAPAEAAPQAGSGALLGAVRAEAAAWAVPGGAAGLRLAAALLAAPEPAAVLQRAARDAAEVQHGVALQAPPSAADLSEPPSAAAFRAPCHDRVRSAPARPEQETSAHVMPCLRAASPSEPLWQAARDEVLS